MNCRNCVLRPLLAGLFVLVLASSADAATLNVPADYATIQAAINAAAAEDTVLVQSGTYYENVVVNKQLTLQGVDSGSSLPVVDAGGSGSAITLSANGCTLQNFVARNSSSSSSGIRVSSSYDTISGNTATGNSFGIVLDYSSNSNTISGNTATGNSYGIYLSSSNGNTISGNTATGNTYYGIYLQSSSGNTISGNTATGNYHGIYLQSSSGNTITGNTATGNYVVGIYLYYSSGNTISGNTATGNVYGIVLGASSNNNTITGNTATGNTYFGIYLYSSSNNNTITGNTATGNTYYGIYLSSSSGNTIFLNTFDNTNNAWSNLANYWNATTPQTGHNLTGLLGNIWSDYSGFDCDGDGIGDTSYLIAGGSDQDYHPIGGAPCTKKLLCISGYKHDGCTGLPMSGWRIKVNNSTQEWNVTTDGNGFWRVCNLENDTYTIQEVPQSGWAQTYPAGFHSETLAGVNITNINFTNQRMYCISGYKKDNSTGAPIPGWNITLQNATHTVSQLTGPDGKYEFCNLKPGDYTITEEARSGYTAVNVVANPVTLNCSNITNQNFTNTLLPCIEGWKINYETGEGIAGWTISLSNDSGILRNTSTNATGWYQFCDLEPGRYTVCEKDKPGWTNVTPSCIDVDLGLVDEINQNFSNIELLCIEGYKIDYQTGQGIAGWTISLSNDSGIIRNTSTNATGWYQFCDLEPGQYRVCEKDRPGWTNVTPSCIDVDLGPADKINQNFTNIELLCIEGYKIDYQTGQGIAGWTISLSNDSGIIRNTSTNATGWYQFCYLEPGQYRVCEKDRPGWTNVTPSCIDVDLGLVDEINQNFYNTPLFCINGSKTSNCTGEALENWTIELRDEAGALIDSKKTNSNGDYSFCNLDPGSYTVCELLQEGWKNVTPSCIPVTLDTDSSENIDFVNDPPVCISGRKINDCTEEGIAGWKITLYDALGEEIGTAITDANGRYSFCNLKQGIYYVCEEEKEGWTAVRDETGAVIGSAPSDGISQPPISCDQPWCDDNCVCVDVDCEGAEVDFRNIPESLCINGSKINNCTGAAIAGWGIYLYDATGTNIRTVQTDSHGRYSFCGLPPGQYRVCEEIRDGWIPVTYINHSGASCLPEDCTCDVCNNCIPVILDCENSEDNDFENIPPTSIKGKVIDDCTGEGLENWEIHLYDSGGNLLDTRWTAWDGSYEFVSSTTVTGGLKLTAGSLYTVCETVKSGWTPVTYHANNTSQPMSNENCIPVFLDCGETVVEDFENIPPLCISGHEFNHCTGEGLAGWTMLLKDSSGNVIRTMTTDSRGSYRFCGLKPGWYTVCEQEIPEGWTSFREDPNSPAMALPGTSGAPEDCETPKCIVVNLDYCEESTDNDFENIPPFCINGTVYNNSTEVAGFPVKIENSDGTQILSIPTDAYGEYSFCGLKAGTYTVCVDKPGWTADEPCVIVYLDCMDEEHDFDVYMGRSNVLQGIEQPAITLSESSGAVVQADRSEGPSVPTEPDIGGDEEEGRQTSTLEIA